MRASLIEFPGANRDIDMQLALERAIGRPVDPVWHRDSSLPETDLIVLPGGFSYGDYLRAGAIAARSPVLREVVRAAERGVPVLGVCNGFQILVETGLLPGALLRNAGLKFVCRDVHLQVESSQTVFTNAYDSGAVIRVPVAHHDGQYFADEDTLARLEDNGQIAFRYVEGDVPGPANPNGSVRDIAGIYNESRTVLGMMPHPEDATDALHDTQDGCGLFNSLAAALA
ncbi:MAG TPA: phosphoribosylformylglycinamidine synthase subunit PurQ [Alphaproteobacteria bacterium]|jgi:phosphoribosylformylglycinamidine synthase|nr:phosphoribosylformylglycinamidine synthase subunit PurQ [Alphaproteobacteria bacterium]